MKKTNGTAYTDPILIYEEAIARLEKTVRLWQALSLTLAILLAVIGFII